MPADHRSPGTTACRSPCPSLDATDEEIDAQIDRLRQQLGELNDVSRPAQDGDHVTIDLKGYRHDEPVAGLNADDFIYEVGSGTVVPELDEQLRGAKAGDILKFNAEPSATARRASPSRSSSRT